MRKIFLLIMTFFVFNLMNAQRFQCGDLYYNLTSDSTVEIIAETKYHYYKSVDNYSNLTELVIPSIIECEGIPSVRTPGEGKVTIVLHAPEDTNNGIIAIGNAINDDGSSDWDLKAKNHPFKTIEGYHHWYQLTLPANQGLEIKVCAIDENGDVDWDYQWGTNKENETPNVFIMSDNCKLECEFDGGVLLTNLVENTTAYIDVRGWKNSSKNKAGTASINLTTIGFPTEAIFAIVGSGLEAGAWACPPPTEHIMSPLGDGKYTLTLNVPNDFQYKYLVSMDGITWRWDWSTSGDNFEMPLGMVTNDTWIYTNDMSSIKAKNKTTIQNRKQKYIVTSIASNAFKNCKSITSISIPNSVTTIGDNAFINSQSISSLSIPNSVNIGKNVFLGCDSLVVINILADNITDFCTRNINKQIYDAKYYGKRTIFIAEKEVLDIIIPNSVSIIPDYLFYNCSSIKSIYIPNSVMSIGEGAFWNCSSLSSIDIPKNIENIGYYAFLRCTDLISIRVDKENSIFDSRDNCNAIIESSTNTLITGCKNTIVPDNINKIGYYAFAGSSIDSIYIPECVTSIEEAAFAYCDSLSSLTINEGVANIGSIAFFQCPSLCSINLPNSLVNIGVAAFQECSSLQSITLGRKLVSIENQAFAHCPNLDTITVLSVEPPSIGTSVFTSKPLCYIPCGTLNKYSMSIWSEYVQLFEEEILLAYSGMCGKNANWIYNNMTLIIDGVGDIDDYDTHCVPWLQLVDSIVKLEISNGISSIGKNAFANCIKLNTITLPNSLEIIDENAFNGCRTLYDIYCYAKMPPIADESSFINYNAYVYVPCESQRYYQADMIWRKFKNLQCLTSDNAIITAPSINTSTVKKVLHNGRLFILREGKTYTIMGLAL